jgi:phage-related holin
MSKLHDFDYWAGLLVGVIAWITAYVAPAWPFIVLVMALVITDLYTGTKAAKARGEKITSRGLKRTVEKIVLYFAAIMLSKGMGDVFSLPIDFTYITAFTISLAEIKSNFENIHTVTGVNIWQSIIEAFQNLKKK